MAEGASQPALHPEEGAGPGPPRYSHCRSDTVTCAPGWGVVGCSLSEPQGPRTPPGKVGGGGQQARQLHAILEEGTLGFLPAVSASKRIPEAGSLGQARMSGPSPGWPLLTLMERRSR